MAEIAEAQRVPVGTVKSRVRLAVERLRHTTICARAPRWRRLPPVWELQLVLSGGYRPDDGRVDRGDAHCADPAVSHDSGASSAGSRVR